MSITIHGKSYTMVAERMNILKEKTKGVYSLETEVLKLEDGHVLVKATLTIEGRGVYTGHAFEEMGANQINKTSFVEVAETSALGRSMASAGLHGSGEFCSGDELLNAKKRQSVDNSPKTAPNTKDNGSGDTSYLFPVKSGPNKGRTWEEVDDNSLIWAFGIEHNRERAVEEFTRRFNFTKEGANGDKNIQSWLNRNIKFFHENISHFLEFDRDLVEQIHEVGLSASQRPDNELGF